MENERATKEPDRRVRKTRQALREGLLKLMKLKPVNEISVRELAQLCDINRGTFYLHYKDVFDMVEHLEQEVCDEFDALVPDSAPKSPKDMERMLLEIFRFIEDHRDICEVTFGPYGNRAFVMRITEMVKRRFFTSLGIKDADEWLADRCYNFVVFGALGLVQEWLSEENPASAQQMAEVTAQFIYSTCRIFLE